jgi:hypothetical protein
MSVAPQTGLQRRLNGARRTAVSDETPALVQTTDRKRSTRVGAETGSGDRACSLRHCGHASETGKQAVANGATHGAGASHLQTRMLAP